MLNEHVIIFIAGVFIASVSQVLLKISAKKDHPSELKEYMNPLVITGPGAGPAVTAAGVLNDMLGLG